MMDLGKLFLPTTLDYEQGGNIKFRTPENLHHSYYNETEYQLNISFDNDILYIDYINGEGTYLSFLLEMEEGCIAYGCPSEEAFDVIQSRAFKVLSNYLDESQQKILEDYPYYVMLSKDRRNLQC